MRQNRSLMESTRRGSIGFLVALALLLGCVLDIRLGDDSGEKNAASTCGSDELLALAFTVDVQTTWHPSTWPVGDWWFVYPGDGPSYAISRCADEVIALPDHVLLAPIPNQPSALYFEDNLETGGLMRIDLAEGGRTTRLHTVLGRGNVGPFDGRGGVFFDLSIADFDEDHFVKGDVGFYSTEVWRAPDLITPMASVMIHPQAMGPFEMSDGWYLRTHEKTWSRVNLSTNSLVPIHAATWFVVPNRSGDAWVWADATDAQEPGGVESFVHHLDSGKDVPIGFVGRSTTAYPVGLDWNEAGTHIILRKRVSLETFMLDVYEFVGIDANTGERSEPLAPEDGWTVCYPGFVETYGHGFLLCRAEEGSYNTDYYFFDPETGPPILLQDEDVFGPPPPGWMSGDKSYYPLADDRYITGQSLPGFPMEEYYPSVDRWQMFLVDHERGERHPLMTKYPSDVMTVSQDSRLIAYTDAERDGFYIRSLPLASPPD